MYNIAKNIGLEVCMGGAENEREGALAEQRERMRVEQQASARHIEAEVSRRVRKECEEHNERLEARVAARLRVEYDEQLPAQLEAALSQRIDGHLDELMGEEVSRLRSESTAAARLREEAQTAAAAVRAEAVAEAARLRLAVAAERKAAAAERRTARRTCSPKR